MNEAIDFLIVGGGPAGHAAAGAYRDAGGAGTVAIVTDEHRIAYRRPPLTKELLRGEIDEAELPLDDEDWLTEQSVALISGRAVALDPQERLVTLSGGRAIGYGRCLLATGAEPTRAPVPGADDPGVRVLRSLDQFREIAHRLRDGGRVAVIGSGFIGCEIAASLRRRGHAVVVVSDEHAPNAARLGDDAAQEIAAWLADEGVELMFGSALQSITRHTDSFTLVSGGGPIRCDLVVMATGVAPRLELAHAAGLDERDGAIAVDASLRTSAAGLLAAGDVVSAVNATARRPLRVEHWGDALGQGGIAGRVAAGEDAEWADVPGFWSQIGDRTLKHAAWGDGFDDAQMTRDGEAFVVRYRREGRLVGVLTHDADDAYEAARDEIAEAVPAR